MDPQTIEKAIKRCIDISTRLGALEDELPPTPAAELVCMRVSHSPASDRQEPKRRHHRNDAHALNPQCHRVPRHRRIQIRTLNQILMPSSHPRLDALAIASA